MPDEMQVQEVDRDGAVAEAVEGLQSSDRRGALRRFGLLAGGGLVAAAVPFTLADAQSGLSKRDVEILNYALTLEYLEAAFYDEALAKGRLEGSVRNFAQVVGAHENAHVQTLLGVLGSQATKKPSFDFKGTTNDQKTFLSTAKTLEDTGVAAYQGQATRVQSDTVLASAGAILAVEARHAAWVRNLIAAGKGLLPAPEAFSKPMSMQEVLDAVEGTGFIKG